MAGMERGINEHQPTFSACFGAAFLSLHPTIYAKVLSKFLPATLEFIREPFPGRLDEQTEHALDWFGNVHTES